MKKMTKAMLMTALILGSVQWGGTPVHANELDTFALDEYVVTATRTPVKVFDANANISVVTREEIENAHYDNVEQALRNVPGVQIQNYGLAGYNSNVLRINGASNVVVLVDGVRVNHAGQSNFQLADLTTDNVQSIEILKGAASALYGADAKGGVINVVTRTPNSNKTKITIAGGNFSSEQYRIRNEGKEKTWSYSIDVAKERQGDIEDGAGKKWDNKYDSESVNLKVRKELGEESDLVLTYDYNQYDWKYENIPSYQTGQYGAFGHYGDSTSKALGLTWNQKIDESTKNVLSIRNSEYEWESFSGYYGFNYKTLAISDYLTKQFGEHHNVTLGVDYVRDEDVVSGKTSYSKIYNRAVYLQDEWSFDEKWKLTSGIRYDDHSWAGNSTTPRFNLGYKFNENTNIYASYSEFFVAPTLSQLKGGWGTDPNPNLKPEEGENIELGVNHKFDDTTAITAHVFKRTTDEKIMYNFLNNRNDNVNEEDAKGFDLQLSKAFGKGFTLYTGYTYSHFEDEQFGDNYKGLFPRQTVNLGLDYTNEKFNAIVNARAILELAKGEKAVQNMFPDNNYVIVDIATNYKVNNNLKLFAKVNNLFDKYYSEGSEGIWGAPGEAGWYAMPGRTILVGMEYSF